LKASEEKLRQIIADSGESIDFDKEITEDDFKDLPESSQVLKQIRTLQARLEELESQEQYVNLDGQFATEQSLDAEDESGSQSEQQEEFDEDAMEGETEKQNLSDGDVDLSKYDLESGDYIEAQTFLQDVSKFKVNNFPIEKRTRVVDMIERARRILKNYKEDREFWEEFTVIRQLHEFSILNEHHYRPILSPQLKDNIYHLHASNPEEWTIGKLAQKFRMKKPRIEAILRLKIDEYRLARENPSAVQTELGDQIEEAYSEYFGMVGIDQWALKEVDDRTDITEPRWRSALVTGVDEEEDVSKLTRKAVRVQEQWDELPADRPTGQKAYQDSYPDGQVIRKPQYKYQKRPRTENIFIDTSPIENFEEQALMFWVGKDGSMRHLTWEERVAVFKRGPFGDNRSIAGGETQITLIDPVLFPADAEEEKLIEEQRKPLWKNRRFAQATVISEKDILHKLDHAYGSISPIGIKQTSYLHGRIPWSVQEVLKNKRATNVLDTIYKPTQFPPF